LGIDPEPSAAYEMFCTLGIFSKFDNPYFFRWLESDVLAKDKKLHFKNKEMETGSMSIIKKPIEDVFKDVRKDIKNIPVFTIDPELTGEKDDGISLIKDSNGNEWIFIHIADPLRYFTPTDPVYKIAKERVTTIFLPEIKYPMFTESLEKILFSLESGKQTYTITLGVVLNGDGSIQKYQIFPSIIEKVYNITYDELDYLLYSNRAINTKMTEIADKHMTTIANLEKYATLRRNYRIKNGASITHVPKSEIVVKKLSEKRYDYQFRIVESYHKNSRGIITELMMLANEVVTEFCSKQDIPLLYTGHNKKKKKYDLEEKIKKEMSSTKVEPTARPKLITDDIIRGKSDRYFYYTTMKIVNPHVGLKAYAYITSPIRRFIALLNHVQLRAAMSKLFKLKQSDFHCYSEGQIEEILPHIVDKERDVHTLTDNCSRHWMLRYISKFWEKDNFVIYDAYVIEMDEYHPVKIFIIKFAFTAEFIPKVRVTKGEKVYVLISYIDPFHNEILLDHVTNKEQKNLS